MNEKFNKKAKVEQLTKMFLSRGDEKGLIVKDPLYSNIDIPAFLSCTTRNLHWHQGVFPAKEIRVQCNSTMQVLVPNTPYTTPRVK